MWLVHGIWQHCLPGTPRGPKDVGRREYSFSSGSSRENCEPGNGLEDFGEADFIAARRNSVCKIGTDAWRHRTARGGTISYLQNNKLFCWLGRNEKFYVPGRMFGPGVTKHLEVLRYNYIMLYMVVALGLQQISVFNGFF